MTSRDFHKFKVVAKVSQSSLITSFDLEPVSHLPLPACKAGQHLVFKFELEGQVVLRHYSLSVGPAGRECLRIAVKREGAPVSGPDLVAGLVSNHLHDQVEVGDRLLAAGPMGDFFLDESSERPVVLLSGGIGITPLLSMLHQLVKHSTRTVHFIHACENSEVHAFADEVLALAALREGVQVHFCYRYPTDADRLTGRCHAEGLLSKVQLQAWLVLDDYDFYLCGPTGFMQSNWHLLRSLGVPRERIRYEFFGPATVLEATQTAVEPELTRASAVETKTLGVAQQGGENSVQFLPQEAVYAWDAHSLSILDFAEAQGLSPDFNCRSGLCNTCMCELVSGEVEYVEEPLDPPPAGKVLLCCAKPKGAIVVKL